MNSASTFDLPTAIADDASDQAKLDYYFQATRKILDDIAQSDRRIEKMQAETSQKLAEVEMALRQLR